jgi:AcrR family transcriptional regulator
MSRAHPYHHGNLRATLLDAAERRIEESGVEQVSLRELARALLDALAERGFERLAAGLREAAGRAGPGFEARLRAIGAAYVALASSNPALLELMYADKPGSDATRLQAAAADVLSEILGLVADGVAGGALAADDPERYARLCSPPSGASPPS